MSSPRPRGEQTRGALDTRSPVVIGLLIVILIGAVAFAYLRTRGASGPSEGDRVKIDVNKVKQQFQTEGFGHR